MINESRSFKQKLKNKYKKVAVLFCFLFFISVRKTPICGFADRSIPSHTEAVVYSTINAAASREYETNNFAKVAICL